MSRSRLRLFAGAALFLAVSCGAHAAPMSSPDQAAPDGRAEGIPTALATPTGTIEGTLDIPGGPGPCPVALIISGSGPTDRNGNSPLLKGRNDALLMVARALREAGIASVRYDKRGIGQSAQALTSESLLTFTDYVDDAAAWIRQLKGDPRFSRVAVIGHSEGSLIGMEAARIAGADAFVSLDGPGRPAPAVLKEQLRSQPAPIRDTAFSIIDSLSAGTKVSDVPKDLAPLFRPAIQPYLISWFSYDPARAISRLRMPVLIVQGTTDLQVSLADARLLHDASPGSELRIIDGMNHVLKSAPADAQENFAAYSNPDLPLAPAMAAALVDFLRRALRG